MTMFAKMKLLFAFIPSVLTIAYFLVHGLPSNGIEFLMAVGSVAFLVTLIVVVFLTTSAVFGLPLGKVIQDIKNKK